jgi:hypothetical protein
MHHFSALHLQLLLLLYQLKLLHQVYYLEISVITGITLLNSSDSLTGSEPGRVDSPPISIISTPFSMISNE